MRLVVLESPYAGDVEGHVEYARECMRDSLGRGEAPMASHLLYTQALRDDDAQERAIGLAAGLAWGQHASATVVYTDLGISPGMTEGINRATSEGRPVEYRSIG